MKYLKLFLMEHRRKAALALLLLLGQVLGTLLIPFLIAGMVDQGILMGDMDTVLKIGLQMLVVAILSMAVSVWGSWATADLGARFGRDMRERLFAKSQELSIQQFDALGVSSMITRATSDIANLQQTMGMILQLAVPAPIIAVFSVVMTALVNPAMAVLQLMFIVLLLGFAALILKKSSRLSSTIQDRMDDVNQVVRESITGVRVIRAFGNEIHEEKRSGKAFQNYADHMVRLNRLFAVVNPAVWLLLGFMMAAIVGLGGRFVLSGSMAVGEIAAVVEYATLTMAYLILAASAASTLPKASSCMKRLGEVLDTVASVSDPAQPGAKPPSCEASLKFEHVTFTYPGAEEPVLYDLSFHCPAGTTTAVIGSTGSGKSTLADLLLRLHDPQSGQILVGGTDVRTLTQRQLRERIGYVPQKAFLFSGTIAENLRMGRKDASKEQLWEALRIAQADTFVKKLPEGLASPVAQTGSNYSGGQKQRLSIARALVKQAPVLVFDDSFSALDVKTDSALRKALRHSVTAPAKLIIAQRVSTILDADQILVLDEGRLVGMGTHQELLSSCSVYRAIAESQMNRKEVS